MLYYRQITTQTLDDIATDWETYYRPVNQDRRFYTVKRGRTNDDGESIEKRTIQDTTANI